ncbi:MAG: S1/P1 nuclease [Gammaproteobacteria bacterium]
MKNRTLAGVYISLLVLYLPGDATAWGMVGHRIVCEIAYDNLSVASKKNVDTLTAAFRKPNLKQFRHFTESCSFADTARHNARSGLKRWKHYAKYNRWHYLNVARDTKVLTAENIHCADDCVLHAIRRHADILANRQLGSAARGEALILLAHWIADIHQPLHVAFEDDKGGSAIELRPNSPYGHHLHSAWDSGIIKASRGKTRLFAYIEKLALIDDTWSARWRAELEPLQWANESYQLATLPAAQYCAWREQTIDRDIRRTCAPLGERANIDQGYQKSIAPLLERRLQQAAVRLASTLERILSNDSAP